MSLESDDERVQRFAQLATEATSQAADRAREYYATHPRRTRTRVEKLLEAIQAPFCNLFKRAFFPFAP